MSDLLLLHYLKQDLAARYSDKKLNLLSRFHGTSCSNRRDCIDIIAQQNAARFGGYSAKKFAKANMAGKRRRGGGGDDDDPIVISDGDSDPIVISDSDNEPIPYSSRGCKNTEDPWVGEDEFSDTTIQLGNGWCFEIIGLGNYLVRVAYGFNQFRNTRIAELDGTQIFSSREEINDFVEKYDEILSTSEHSMPRIEYENARNEILPRLRRLVNEIHPLTVENANDVLQVAAICSSQGPIFVDAINREWDDELVCEWVAKVRTQTGLEPPRNMSANLTDALNNIKAMALGRFFEKYESWSQEQKDILETININYEIPRNYILQALNGQECLKCFGGRLLMAYNTWAVEHGREQYIADDNNVDVLRTRCPEVVDANEFGGFGSFGGNSDSDDSDDGDDGDNGVTNADIALIVEAHEGNVNGVVQLLANGANVHANDDFALRSAAEEGHLQVVQLLIDNGANVRASGDHALRVACAGGHLQVVQLLIDNGADVRANDDGALIQACTYGRTQVVGLLINYGANVRARDDEALMIACANGHLEVVRLLIRYGANVDADASLAGFPLLVASRGGYLEIVTLLLDNGAYEDMQNVAGTALMAACREGKLEVARLLLTRGVNVNALDGGALRDAVINDHPEIVRLLLDHGANNAQAERLARNLGLSHISRLFEEWRSRT